MRLRIVKILRICRAVIGAGRYIHRSPLEGGDAKVGYTAIGQVFALNQQLGVCTELDGQGGRQRFALQELLVAIAISAFQRAGHAKRHIFVAVVACQIKFATALVPATGLDADFGLVDAGFFGDAVDQATGRSAPVQHRCRPFDHFHLFDIRQVAEIHRVVAQAVNELIGNRGEAADRDLIALAIASR